MRFQARLLASLAALAAAGFAQTITTLDANQRAELRLRQPARLALAADTAAAEKARLQLGEEHALRPRLSVLSQSGTLHTRFRQYYRGVRVFEGDMIVHLDREDRAKPSTHSLLTGIQLDVNPAIDEKQAVRAALGNRDAATGATVETELVVFRARLAWLISVDEPGRAPHTWLLDAHGGAVLSHWRASQDADYTPVTATGRGRYVGQVSFAAGRKTELANPFDARYWIIDPARNNNKVMNVDNVAGASGAMYGAADTEFGDGEVFNPGTMSSWSITGQTMAVDLAYSMQKLWDLLFHKFGREGLDGNGFAMVARAHARKESDEEYADAFWSSTAKATHYGDGKSPDFGNLGRPSFVGHEFGHGVWHFALDGPSNTGEAAGLNEGNADIQGSILHHYMNRAHPVHELPEEATLESFSGRMREPSSYKDGAGRAYYEPGMGDLEEHVQGCALGHMFIFLARGSSENAASALHSVVFPNGMAGIGLRKAAEIWYEAITGHLSGAPTFAKMRTAYLDAAEELFGVNSLERKAVANAFAAINVGTKWTDSAKPDVSLGNPIDSEHERSLFVSASASDDVGVVRMDIAIDGGVRKSIAGLPNAKFLGYLDIGSLGTGTRTVKVTAYDAAGKSDETSKQFTLSGVNQLIKNGGFENGGSEWEEAPTVSYADDDEAGAFLGKRYAVLGLPGSFMRQKVTVPATANQLSLSYRVRVLPGEVPGPEFLFVRILSSNGAEVLDNVATHSGDIPTADEVTNGYKYHSHGLPDSLIGKTVYVQFLAQALLPVRFRVDNVSLVWSGTVSGKVTVNADPAEGSVYVKVDNLVNATPATLKLVRLVVNGAQAGGDAFAPYEAMWPASEFLPEATHRIKAEMINHGNVKIGQTPETAFFMDSVTQLVKNPGFESGTQNWAYTGGTKFGQNSGEAQIYLSFLGNRFVYFDASAPVQTLYQQVYIPKADTAQLSFRLRVDSSSPWFTADDIEVRIALSRCTRVRK